MDNKNTSASIKKKNWFRASICIVISIILLMSFSKLYPISKAKEGTSIEEFTHYLDNRISDIMRGYEISGANVALIKGGKTIWIKSYGYADVGTKRKMTSDTYLRLESISKSVTAWGVMKLVEQGKIELDSPVKKYLKSWNFPTTEFSEDKITVKQLLSHSAGLPLGDFTKRYAPTQDIPSLRDSLSAEAVLEREPGVSFSYSNMGYNILELMIEEVTNTDFSKYMESEILIPLKMNNSSYKWSDEYEPIPFGYDLNGNAVPVYIYPEKGSGGLFATIEDVATFVEAGMSNIEKDYNLIEPESINKLYSPMVEKLGIYSYVFDSYGLGYYIENLTNGNRAVAHGGQGAGWMTHFHLVPDSGDGIVILTNSQRSWPFIAYLLSDWAKWCGFSHVVMSRIIYGLYTLWTLILTIWIILLLQIWKFIEEVTLYKRKLMLIKKHYLFAQIVQISLSVALLAGLYWCTKQDYLFISSVFPIASKWLGITIFIFAIIMILFAFFPKREF